MNENLQPDVLVENSLAYQEGLLRDGCVGNTIASICSRIINREVGIPPIYYAWRGMMIKDEVRLFGDHMRRRRERGTNTEESKAGLTHALHRLDQRAFKQFFGAIQSGRVPMFEAVPLQDALEMSTIEYRRGGIESIQTAITSGSEVAVSFQTAEDPNEHPSWHMAHIGLNSSNQLVRFSDGGQLVTPQTMHEIGTSAQYLNEQVRTWNFVTVKNNYA